MKKLIIACLILSLTLSIFAGCSLMPQKENTPEKTEAPNQTEETPDQAEKCIFEVLDKTTNNWVPFDENAVLFNDLDKFEPGYRAVAIIKITNNTESDYKWSFSIATDKAINKLADAVDLMYCYSATLPETDGYSTLGKINEYINKSNGAYSDVTSSKTEAYLGIMLKMIETAGNEYHGLTLEDLTFSIKYAPAKKYASSIDGKNDGFSVAVSTSKTENNGEDMQNFSNIFPGDVIDFTPYVKNTGTYNQLIRVTVTVTDHSAFKKIYAKDDFSSDLLKNVSPALVKDSFAISDYDELVCVYYLNKILTPNDTVLVFDKVQISETLTQQDVATSSLKDGFNVTVLAEAVEAGDVNQLDSSATISAIAKEIFKEA